MNRIEVIHACAAARLRAGRAVREAVHALPLLERVARNPSLLKPRIRELTRNVDRVADDVAIEVLEELGATIGHRIELIVDPANATVHTIGGRRGREVVFAYMDAVDGTIKVGGLGNDLAARRIRTANDGGWAAAVAFTAPTDAPLERIAIGDFVAVAMVDGNPTRFRAYPQEVVVLPGEGGPVTYDMTGAAWNGSAAPQARTFTSTGIDLSQGMVYLDSFQAFDRETRAQGDEELAVELYRHLINRHDGGAFDVLRQYANLSALMRVMLGWRDDPVWFESQGAGFVVVNENLANLIPAVPVVEGAGGVAVDFDGRRLAERKLLDGRTSVLYAANHELCRALLERVAAARRRAGGGS
jgi:hypothetical protein